MNYKNNVAFSKNALFWAALFLVLACLVSAFTPPLRSPDESLHVRRAYLLSRGEIVLKTGPVEYLGVEVITSGGEIDIGLDSFLAYHLGQIGKPDPGIAAIQNSGMNDLQWTGVKAFRPAPGASYYFPFLYAPQAVALLIGEKLKLSIASSYTLARGFALVSSAMLLWGAFCLYPVNVGLLALISLPMAMFQMSSASLDGISNALAALEIAAFLRMHKTTSAGNSRFAFALWCLGLSLLVTCRPHLLPILTLPFILYRKRRERHQLVSGLIALAAAIAWFSIAISTSFDPRVQLGQSTSALVRDYVMHPNAFFVVLWQTLNSNENLQFFWKSFIGILGWLELPLPEWAYSFISASGVALLILGLLAKPKNTIGEARLSLTMVALASVLLVFFALLVTWTPHPADVIKGVQGRYFFVPGLMLAYAWQQPWSALGVWQRRFSGIGLLSFIAFNVFTLTATLQQRYPSTWAADTLRLHN